MNQFFNRQRRISTIDNNPEDKFQHYIKVFSLQRVEDHYRVLFEDLIDMEKVRESEKHLHPGFDKVCGLKGSRLSGGQK